MSSLLMTEGHVQKSLTSLLRIVSVIVPCSLGLKSLLLNYTKVFLLHKVKWMPNATYRHVCEQYARFLRAHYGKGCIVISDGYGESCICCTWLYSEGREQALRNPHVFLANSHNRQSFQKLLISHLQTERQYNVQQAMNDADTKVASTVCSQLVKASL